MKDVISVDSIIRDEIRGCDEYKKEPDSIKCQWCGETEYSQNHSRQRLKTSLHSLLISKLPEKKPLITDEPLDAMDEGEKFCVECGQWEYEGVLDCKCVGYNSAIDDMRQSIDEMFEVKNG